MGHRAGHARSADRERRSCSNGARPRALVAWAVALFVALGGHGVAHAQPVLRVGTSGDYAPFSEAGRGFDIEVARRFAGDRGLRLQWVPFRWPELQRRVAAGDFDVVMSGVTWRPDRSVTGYMTRAIGLGGPCVLGDSGVGPLGVNQGGILERWARAHFPESRVVAVPNNLALPDMLGRRQVRAIVTDSFEFARFYRTGWNAVCAPARDRKVYWVAPVRARQLGPELDAWLEAHEADLGQLRARWFGAPSSWTPTAHLLDLLARRLALMPAVAAYKRAHGLALEDAPREARVLSAALAEAKRAGLGPDRVERLFRLQMELAKAVQARQAGGVTPPLDLERQLRPALITLGGRIVSALARARGALRSLTEADVALLDETLTFSERGELLEALRAVDELPPSGP